MTHRRALSCSKRVFSRSEFCLAFWKAGSAAKRLGGLSMTMAMGDAQCVAEEKMVQRLPSKASKRNGGYAMTRVRVPSKDLLN